MTLEKQIKHINNSLFVAKMENIILFMYEDELKTSVAEIFHSMRTEILANLEAYYGDVLFNAHMDLILAPIHEHHKQYYETIVKYKLKEHRKGRVQGKRLITRAKKYAKQYSKAYYSGAVKADTINIPMGSIIEKDKLFATSDYSAEQMRDKTFVASENTLARVDKDINGIITGGYRDGWGINDVANKIETRFNQLETWEARRIARTEIHGSHMQGVMNSYEDMGVEYLQWGAAHDNRTRDTHAALDGEIIPWNGVFSNGLRYPGDTNGPISEWINCRCGVLPWFCPPGMMVPVGMSNFRESDLLPLGTLGTGGDLLNSVQTEVFDEAKFAKLKTNEEIADFFGYEYIPKGRYYEAIDGKTFEFYDRQNDVYLRFFREGDFKCTNIDFTNSGKAEYDLKEVLRIYDETHPNLKVGLDDINFKRWNSHGHSGDASNHTVNIYDLGLSKGKYETFESILDHELGHIFEDTFLLDKEFSNAVNVASELKPKINKATKLDIDFHNKKGVKVHSISDYATTNDAEEFAELVSQEANLRRGKNYTVPGERIKIKDETRSSGFKKRRYTPTLAENKENNPNRFSMISDLLDHPEKINPNWKSETQIRVKNSRKHLNDFIKEEQSIVRAKKIKGYDEFKLTSEEKIELKKLQSKDKILFLDRNRIRTLEEKEMFNSLNNKYITEGKLSLEEAKDFRTLQNSMKIRGIYDGELTSLEKLQGIKIKPAEIAKPSPKEEIAQINRNEIYDGIKFKDFTNDPDKLLDKQIEAQLKVNYSQKHISVVNNYGEEGFRDINKYLNGREDYRIDVNTLENKIKTLTEAIDISPPLQENSVLWRGGELTKELKEYVNLIEKGELSVNDIEGKSGIFKSFSSTSVDRDVALDFKEEDEERWLYKILADTNTEGLHIDDYEIFSGLAEDEILIQRGYKFDVITMDLEKQELTIILRSVEL